MRRAALWLSRVFHPFLISPLAILLMVGLDQNDWGAALRWALICAAFVVLPGSLYILRKLRAHAYADADVSVQAQRRGLYLFGAGCMALCFAYLLWAGAPRVLIGGFVAAGAALGLAALINRYWLISVHVGALFGVAAAAAFYAWPLAVALLALTGLTAWSRHVLQRHTGWDMLLAGVTSGACVVALFPWFVGARAAAWPLVAAIFVAAPAVVLVWQARVRRTRRTRQAAWRDSASTAK
jgi:hypothetical protein